MMEKGAVSHLRKTRSQNNFYMIVSGNFLAEISENLQKLSAGILEIGNSRFCDKTGERRRC